jgi:Flp pilus assembly protein TadG
MAMELAVLTPALGLMFVFVVWTGRAGQTTAKLEHAADRGARAASLVSRARMASVGADAALAELAANGADCTAPSAAVIVLADRVQVSVSCAVNVQGISSLPARIVTAMSSEPIDEHRADEP